TLFSLFPVVEGICSPCTFPVFRISRCKSFLEMVNQLLIRHVSNRTLLNNKFKRILATQHTIIIISTVRFFHQPTVSLKGLLRFFFTYRVTKFATLASCLARRLLRLRCDTHSRLLGSHMREDGESDPHKRRDSRILPVEFSPMEEVVGEAS